MVRILLFPLSRVSSSSSLPITFVPYSKPTIFSISFRKLFYSSSRRTSYLSQTIRSSVSSIPKKLPTNNNGNWRILITSPIPPIALRKLSETPGLIIVNNPSMKESFTHTDLLSHLQSIPIDQKYDAFYVTLVNKIDRSILSAASPRLKMISSMSVGYNHIDLKACQEYGIKIGHTPDVLTESTADIVVLLILAACRRVGEGMKVVKQGKWGEWKFNWMCGVDLYGSTVGIIGLGRIGMAVAKRLKAFHCNILYSSVKGRIGKEKIKAKEFNGVKMNFDDLIKLSDIVVPLCPLTIETKGLFNLNVFQMMKSNAVFVNVARGEIVVQDDLYYALKEKLIYAAGLDVTTPEPLPRDNKLLELDNCIVLPHIGSATNATREKMAILAADNLINVFQNRPMKAPVL